MLLSILPFLISASIKDCGTGSLFKITELSQDPPDSIKANENLHMTLKYSVPSEVISGTATKTITLNYIPFSPTVEDLCINAPCPITVGDHDGSTTYPFPSGVSGTLVSKVEWKDDKGRQLLCIQSTLKASNGRPTFGSIFSWK